MTVTRGVPAALLLAAMPAVSAGQAFQAGIATDSATVGAVVHVVVSGVVEGGTAVVFPDSLPVRGDLENAARRVDAVDTVASGIRRSAVYAVTPWRPGELELPGVQVRVVTADGARTVDVQLPSITVASVLPQDTAGVQARPPRDVIGPSWLLWPLLLLGAVLVAMLAGAMLWYRKRRPPAEAPPLVPRRSPGERALAALDRAWALGLVEAGRFKAFYSLVAEALRHYLAALEPEWGEDLTTSELLAACGEMQAEERRALREILDAADRVKFARHRPEAREAEEVWRWAREWVVDFRPPVQPAEREEAA